METKNILLVQLRDLYSDYYKASKLCENNKDNFLHASIAADAILIADFEDLLRCQFFLSQKERDTLIQILRRSFIESPVERFSPSYIQSDETDNFIAWFEAELIQHFQMLTDLDLINALENEDEETEETKETEETEETEENGVFGLGDDFFSFSI